MLELDACVPGLLREKSNFDLRSALGTRVRLPVRTNFKRDYEALGWLPHAHVSDHDIRAVLAPRVPAPPDVRFDERLRDRRGTDAVRLWPPAVDAGRKYVETRGRRRRNDDGLADRCDLDRSVQGF